MGELQPTSDQYYVSVVVEMPELYGDYIDTDIINTNLSCPLDMDDYVRMICTDFVPVFRQYSDRAKELHQRLSEKFKTIETSFQPVQRSKRAIPIIPLLGFFTAGFKSLSTILQIKRTDSLKKSIAILGKSHFRLEQDYIDFKKDMLSITKSHNDQIETNARQIKAIFSIINRLAIRCDKEFKNLNSKVDKLEQRTWAIKLLSVLTTRIFTHINRAIGLYEDIIEHADIIIDSITSLMKGLIPTKLINPMKLKDIMAHASEVLYKAEPNYVLSFDKLEQYYRLTNTGFTFIENRLIIQLALPIRPRHQNLLKLYKIDVTYVPYNVTQHPNQASNSYTKVDIESDYIAVFEDNFVQLNKNTFDLCTNYESTYICQGSILEIHKSRKTCAISIFWDADFDTVSKLCHFNYFHKFKPAATILDAGDQILLANLDLPWVLKCRDRAIPIRVDGHHYAVISRASLCYCDLATRSHFLAGKLTNCNGSVNSLQLKYTVNGASLGYFSKGKIPPTQLNIDIKKLYNDTPMFDLPMINVRSSFNEDVLDDNDLSEPVDLGRVASLIKSHSSIYYTNEDKIHAESDFQYWFSKHNVESGIVFVMSILGFISLIITIVLCIRHHRWGAVAGALFAGLPQADAHPLEPVVTMDIPMAILYNVCLLFALYFIFKTIYMLLRKLDFTKILLPSVNEGGKLNMLINLTNGKGSILVYLCTFHASINELTTPKPLNISAITFTNKYIYGTINIDWESSDVQLYHKGSLMKLPTIAYISPVKLYQSMNILKQPCAVRLLIGNVIYEQLCIKNMPSQWPTDNRSSPWDV